MPAPDLSICCPFIRPHLIPNLYDSIRANFHRSFELILCGPNPPSTEILNKPDIKYIQDYGHSVRACSIAASHATGKYMSMMADDATFLSKSISRSIIKLEKWGETHDNYKHVVTGKYVEGNMDWWLMTIETGTRGYTINTSYTNCKYIPDEWIIFNIFYMHTDYFRELGGYDCQFEQMGVALTDLAARAQRDGCTTELMDEPTFVLSHQPGTTGDHAPVHYSQIQHDIPLFENIYNSPESINRINIPLDNWKNADTVWRPRFR